MPRRGPLDISIPPIHLVKPELPRDELPPPPEHLSEAMKLWWRQVMDDYALDQHHLHLLECACSALDRANEAREVLRREGLTISTKQGTRRHPCADIERDNRTLFARLLRELDLDADPPKEAPPWRPPALRSNRRR